MSKKRWPVAQRASTARTYTFNNPMLGPEADRWLQQQQAAAEAEAAAELEQAEQADSHVHSVNTVTEQAEPDVIAEVPPEPAPTPAMVAEVSDFLARVAGLGGIRSIEATTTTTHVRVETTSDAEQQARACLTQAQQKVWGNSFDRAATLASVGVGWAVLALVEELRDQERERK